VISVTSGSAVQLSQPVARSSQVSSGSRSMAVSPPHGGTTALMDGSVSMVISSAARSAAGALTCDAPSMHAPTTGT